MPRMTSAEFQAYQMKTARQHNAGKVGEVELRSEGNQELKRSARDPESRLHEQIIDYCNNQWPRWKFIHSRMDQPSTIAVGCQDFTIFAPKAVLLVECKRVGGKLTLEQMAWHQEMRMLGYKVRIVETFDEFLKAT